MAAGSPASAHLQETSVGNVADKNLPLRAGHLRMAAKAEVWITDREHFAVHRTMRVVAGFTTFPHGRMLEHDRARLFSMTLGAAFIPVGHGQSARRLEDIAAMRIVALDAIHPAFRHRMMVGQLKFALDGKVALQAGRRILAGIDDEFGSAAGFNVFAARAVA